MIIATLKRCFLGLVIVFLTLIFGPLTMSADFDLTHWAFQKNIILPTGIVSDNFVGLTLDDEIFAKARPDLADLRIIRDDGLETPYGFETNSKTASSSQLNVPARLISQDYVGNEATVITADLGRTGIRHTGLTLTTSNKNFRRAVQIEGGDDNQTWVKFAASPFIYDDTLKSLPRNTTIDYSEVTSRYLRVTIYDRGEPRLIIAGALARRSVATSDKVPQKLFFRYEPPHTYQLYFGRPEAQQAEYDLAIFASVFKTKNLPTVSLEKIEDNPKYVPPPTPSVPFPARSLYLLVGVVGLTVLIIGGLTFRLFKQTQV